MNAKTKLVRINEKLSTKMQKRLDRQRRATGIFKSGAAYVNGLVAADLDSQDRADRLITSPDTI